jgi:hypothetical protein
MTKLIVAFRDFANAPNNDSHAHVIRTHFQLQYIGYLSYMSKGLTFLSHN